MADNKTFSLAGKVCLVTGASRGVGKGIALQLGQAGATVYITGRTLTKTSGQSGSLTETAQEVEERGGKCIPLECDHKNDSDVKRVFDTIAKQQDGQLDVLVNNAYSAIKDLTDNLGVEFWKHDLSMWDSVNNVGLRGHYICTVHAARLMVPRKRGLIVNISSPGGLNYLFNPAYGIGKEAGDRMAQDCAVDLQKHNVAMVSFWPGGVKTETFMDVIEQNGFKKDTAVAPGVDAKLFESGIEQGESPELSGIAIAALASDPKIMRKTGRVLMAADVADEYGFVDIDGRKPINFRQVNVIMNFYGAASLARWTPNFLKIPKWLVWLGGNRL